MAIGFLGLLPRLSPSPLEYPV